MTLRLFSVKENCASETKTDIIKYSLFMEPTHNDNNSCCGQLTTLKNLRHNVFPRYQNIYPDFFSRVELRFNNYSSDSAGNRINKVRSDTDDDKIHN